MTQTPPPGGSPRRPAPPELDALLESLQGEPRPSSGSASVASPPNSERQPNDVMARRVQALIRAFDVLHRQVGSIASQGETISKVAENQERDAKAIADLQRNMRYMRSIVIQQLQQASPHPPATLPPIQIKLVVGHLVEQYQQAERDAAVLLGWAMLFVGLAVGLGIASAVTAVQRISSAPLVYAAVAIVTLIVALIFGGLARTARSRAAAARRAMDESTLLRSVGTNPVGQPEP